MKIDDIPMVDDDFVAWLREWATAALLEEKGYLPVMPETLLALLKRLETVEAAVKMGVTAH